MSVLDLKYFMQPTPNPMAMKFIFNKDVKAKGKISYNSSEECEHNPLAQNLFTIDCIAKLHFFENVITVTQNGDVDWEELEDDFIAIMHENIETHDPDFKCGISEEERRAGLPEKVLMIEEILDRTVRPGLQGDGGDIVVNEYNEEENKVYVQYQGACVSCPSSSMGTLMAIKNFLRDEFDPAVEVESVDL